MEFVCKNPECPRYDQRDYYSSVSVVMRDGKPFCKQSPCPACGKIREEIKKETPADLKGIYFGRFRAMSKEQKQESLKRRSHERRVEIPSAISGVLRSRSEYDTPTEPSPNDRNRGRN